jgi:hypothetical protein
MSKLRKLTAYDVTFDLSCLEEDIPVRGNAMASGDADEDKRVEDKIIAELDHNLWAWCCARVRATWRGFAGEAYLGGCSYDSEDDFRNDQHFTDMCDEALDQLNTTLAVAAELIVEESDG